MPASAPASGGREALQRANARCEAVVCLLSKQWESRVECLTEYRTAETLNKRVFCARLEPDTGTRTSAWQWCDLFGDGPQTRIDIGDGDPVSFATRGLYRLRDGIRGAGIGADTFIWPVDEPDRAPYRGWAPFDPVDAGIFFGRDAQIVRALDTVRGMRKAQTKRWLVILGPVGVGKVIVSAGRAGAPPAARRPRVSGVGDGASRARRAGRRQRVGQGHRRRVSRPASERPAAGGYQGRLPRVAGAAARHLAAAARRRPMGSCWTATRPRRRPRWCCRWIKPRSC